MFDFLFRVRRVNQINRVSSKELAAENLAGFEVEKIFNCGFSDMLVLFGAIAASILFLSFFVLVNATWASSVTKEKIVELTNANREEKGLAELVGNEKLEQAAAEKADDMIVNDYFSHTSPKGITPWHWFEKEKYDYNYAGENLAMDFVSAEKMNEAWMASPTHRANILNEKYKEIGVAAKEGNISGHRTTVVVQMFGSGDKNVSEKEDSEAGRTERGQKENTIPELPAEKRKIEARETLFASPVITSPQNGEVVSGKGKGISGRARSGSKVRIFDQGKLIADLTADSENWFRADDVEFGEGRHLLKAESEISSGGEREIRISDSNVSFATDTSRPEIRYQFFESELGGKMLIRVFSGKPNCSFKIGGRKISSPLGKSAVAPVRKDALSLTIKVWDKAGNKSFQEVNLANFHFKPGGNFDMIGRFADILAPQGVFAAESGRMAMRNNLGLAESKK